MMKKKIQKIYDAVFEIPLISLPQINIGGNIENNIVIENGYLSTYYQNTTKNIQNIIIRGTANPYINNYPLYGFSNTKPIVGTTLENVAVTIGNGKIRIGLPGINKDIVLDANDIETFKQNLVK